jgi:hypothetical protein
LLYRLNDRKEEQISTAEGHHERCVYNLEQNQYKEALDNALIATKLKPDWCGAVRQSGISMIACGYYYLVEEGHLMFLRAPGWVALGEAQLGMGHYRASVLAYR